MHVTWLRDRPEDSVHTHTTPHDGAAALGQLGGPTARSGHSTRLPVPQGTQTVCAAPSEKVTVVAAAAVAVTMATAAAATTTAAMVSMAATAMAHRLRTSANKC